MTNSPVKAKGPIRVGAVIPAALLSALLVGYFVLFFDHNLRRGIEYIGTHINGAEVNVQAVRTSFLHASLEIREIQITDKNHPERNIIQVGRMHYAMLWDALLRAKVVIDDASITDIQALTPRKSPGYIVPPTPPSKGPSLVQNVEKEVLDQTQKKYQANFLGDLAGLLEGKDPKAQLAGVEGQLKSDQRIKQLSGELKDKKAKWEQKIKALPQGPEFKAYETRIKALKFDLKNPSELTKNLKEADQIRKEIETKVKDLDATTKDVRGEINTYAQSFKDLEKLAQEDLKDLQAKFKLPNIDAKEFSQQLFMHLVEQKLGGLAKYVELARHYMPVKKPGDPKAVAQTPAVPPKRGQGVTYKFPVTTGYPLFWLKHAGFSSEVDQSEYSGHVKGEIRNATSDPVYLREPTTIMVHGDFPKQSIQGVDVKVLLNHTGEVAKDSATIAVASFPVARSQLSSSPDVQLAIEQARGTSLLKAELIDQALKVEMQNAFTEVKFAIDAKNATVKELITAILTGIPKITVNADVTGSLHNFDVHINSNLGDELAKGFQKQLQARIEAAKAQINKLITDQIGGEKEKLKAQMDQVLGPISKLLDSKKSEADQAVNDTKSQATGAKSQQEQTKQKLQDEGKKLLKKFGF